MSSFKLTDVLVKHELLGTNCIQMRFDHPGGEHFNFQWPFTHGKSAHEIACDLHAFADRLNREHVKFIDAAENK